MLSTFLSTITCTFGKICHIYLLPRFDTYAKLIEIQKIYLQKIHGLHELGSHIEYNDTLHGSELGSHWVLGPKKFKIWAHGTKEFCSKICLHQISKVPYGIFVGF